MSISNIVIKRILILIWFFWSALVTLSNLFDVLRNFRIIPDSFKFVSGNLGYITSATSIYSFPPWLNQILFFGVIIWEFVMSLFFYISFDKIKSKGTSQANPAFLMGIILFGGFMVMDELLIAYDRLGSIEQNHIIIFIGMIVSLMFIHIIPEAD